jgi:hypothetical protein
MNGLDFLDLAVGLIFIYLIYSIACSTLWEIIVSFTHIRGKMLCNWILDNFRQSDQDGKTLGEKIIGHPLIKAVSSKSSKRPTYISSAVFTDVILDIIVNDSKDENSASFTDLSTLKNSIEGASILDPVMKRVFLHYFMEASGNISMVKDKIARWYDEAQERLIGSYKKHVQFWIFLISIILVGFTNADTIKLASYLYNNDDAREAIANKATLYIQDSSVIRLISKIDTVSGSAAAKMEQAQLVRKLGNDVKTLKKLSSDLSVNNIPLGWTDEDISGWDIIKKIGGLLLTAFAVSMGSPFWFDILSKLASLRSSGVKPKTAAEVKADE